MLAGIVLSQAGTEEILSHKLAIPPRTSCPDTVEPIEAKKLNPDIKAIALTARDSDDDYKVGFEAGFDHYLTKPFDFGELRSLIAR